MPDGSPIVPHPEYRPNPSRCVEIFGPITDQTAHLAVPQIVRLRAESAEPISVYINSPGGLVRVLDVIKGALLAKDQDGRRVRVITACVGDAASAAANLLTFGDYAIAYPYSIIHFHGIRAGDLELTAEDAAGVARRFSAINRETATELARRVAIRLCHRYLAIKTEVTRRQLQGPKRKRPVLEAFIQCVRSRVSGQAEAVMGAALEDTLLVYRLISGVFSKPIIRNGPALGNDCRVLKALINHEYKEHKNSGFVLDDGGIGKLASDYLLLREFVFRDKDQFMKPSIQAYGAFFLTGAELRVFEDKTKKEKTQDAMRYLEKRARPRAEPFFYFALCLCRTLVQGENRLSPRDAYWLGIVDEIAGTKMSGMRALAEEPITNEKVESAKPKEADPSTSEKTSSPLQKKPEAARTGDDHNPGTRTGQS